MNSLSTPVKTLAPKIKISFPEIKTKRLILRELDESDWTDVQFLRSNSIVNRYIKRPKTDTKGKALEFISAIKQKQINNEAYYWSITYKESPKMIGSICLWNFTSNRLNCEIGYDLNPDFQRNGIMSEAMTSILNYGFYELNLKTISAYTHRENISSRKLLEKQNFTQIKHEIDKDNINNVIYIINTQ